MNSFADLCFTTYFNVVHLLVTFPTIWYINNYIDYPLCFYISGPDSPACDRSTPVVGRMTTHSWRSVDSCFNLTTDPSGAIMVTYGLLCNPKDLYNMGRSQQLYRKAL